MYFLFWFKSRILVVIIMLLVSHGSSPLKFQYLLISFCHVVRGIQHVTFCNSRCEIRDYALGTRTAEVYSSRHWWFSVVKLEQKLGTQLLLITVDLYMVAVLSTVVYYHLLVSHRLTLPIFVSPFFRNRSMFLKCSLVQPPVLWEYHVREFPTKILPTSSTYTVRSLCLSILLVVIWRFGISTPSSAINNNLLSSGDLYGPVPLEVSGLWLLVRCSCMVGSSGYGAHSSSMSEKLRVRSKTKNLFSLLQSLQ